MPFELTPADSPTVVQGLPGDWLQVRADGVDVGDANVEIIDIVGDPTLILATRGVGENAHVITLRKLAPPPGSVDIGWLEPGTDPDGTAAATNSGSFDIEISPFPVEIVIYAGVVAYAAQTVVWSFDWETTGFSGFPPVFADLGGGKCSVTWPNIDFPFNRAYDAGLGTLTATINGTPATTTLEAVLADGLYGDLVWAPAP